MKVLVVADIHEDWPVLEQVVEQENPFAVLSCGDHGDNYHTNFPLYFVPGNHENFAFIDSLRERTLSLPYLALIEPGDTHTITDGVEELRVGGMGGIYNPKFLDRFKESYFMRDDLARLQNTRRADVLLFHETMPIIGLERKEEVMGSSELQRVVKKLGAKMAFTGHYHQYKEVSKNGTDYVAMDRMNRGYAVLTVADGQITREIRQVTRN
tara:strand:- start:1075 stop:1707 length:633 start_codon:yes stop_codon:yes gene_type:complete